MILKATEVTELSILRIDMVVGRECEGREVRVMKRQSKYRKMSSTHRRPISTIGFSSLSCSPSFYQALFHRENADGMQSTIPLQGNSFSLGETEGCRSWKVQIILSLNLNLSSQYSFTEIYFHSNMTIL